MVERTRSFLILGVFLVLFVLFELCIVYGIPRYRAWRDRKRR